MGLVHSAYLGAASCLYLQAKSKPMSEILARLTAGGEFEVVSFGDQVCACHPVMLGDLHSNALLSGVPCTRSFGLMQFLILSPCLPLISSCQPPCQVSRAIAST